VSCGAELLVGFGYESLLVARYVVWGGARARRCGVEVAASRGGLWGTCRLPGFGFGRGRWVWGWRRGFGRWWGGIGGFGGSVSGCGGAGGLCFRVLVGTRALGVVALRDVGFVCGDSEGRVRGQGTRGAVDLDGVWGTRPTYGAGEPGGFVEETTLGWVSDGVGGVQSCGVSGLGCIFWERGG